nr:MAG TPA: hypothetical protein [Caudoviricetes sp.]
MGAFLMPEAKQRVQQLNPLSGISRRFLNARRNQS